MRPAPSSPVHQHELSGTADQSPVAWGASAYERFRHRHWQALRESAYTIIKASGASDGTLARFAGCGAGAQAWHSPSTRRLFIAASTCHSRWCEPCARSRRAKITGNLHRALDGHHLRMITLTLAHHDQPLPDLLTRLWASFKLFRRRSDWQQHVAGFAAFVHVKWSDRSHWWHVHLHVLCEGSWWDRHQLSAAWHACTADSFVTDIREVTTPEGVSYAARYASQPVRLGDVPKEHRPSLFAALHHRRLWLLGGSWKGTDLLAAEPLPLDLQHLDSVSAIIGRAARGDATAREILRAIVGDACEWVEAVEIPPDVNPFDTG